MNMTTRQGGQEGQHHRDEHLCGFLTDKQPVCGGGAGGRGGKQIACMFTGRRRQAGAQAGQRPGP